MVREDQLGPGCSWKKEKRKNIHFNFLLKKYWKIIWFTNSSKLALQNCDYFWSVLQVRAICYHSSNRKTKSSFHSLESKFYFSSVVHTDGPTSPCRPIGPIIPGSPRSPMSPLCPFTPDGPIKPCGPLSPCGPVLPILPMQTHIWVRTNCEKFHVNIYLFLVLYIWGIASCR